MVKFGSKYGRWLAILDNIKFQKVQIKLEQKVAQYKILQAKVQKSKKSNLLSFFSTSAKYVLQVVNIVANRPFWTI